MSVASKLRARKRLVRGRHEPRGARSTGRSTNRPPARRRTSPTCPTKIPVSCGQNRTAPSPGSVPHRLDAAPVPAATPPVAADARGEDEHRDRSGGDVGNLVGFLRPLSSKTGGVQACARTPVTGTGSGSPAAASGTPPSAHRGRRRSATPPSATRAARATRPAGRPCASTRRRRTPGGSRSRAPAPIAAAAPGTTGSSCRGAHV